MIGGNSTLSIRQRILLALVIALASTALCYYNLVQRDQLASDFTWPWRGAMRLLHGENPYDDPRLSPLYPYPFDAPLYYPLPALLVALPFTALPAELAGRSSSASLQGCSPIRSAGEDCTICRSS
jgi:hypothetical protein